MSQTDLELLAKYARQHAEDAFAEIVRRHLGLVYSAALRQVRSPQLAEEVTQSAFIKLACHAAKLKPDTILTAWLYQVTRRNAIDVVRREASRQLREQIATEMNAMNATAADWTHIEPLLDEAMHALDDTDRTAVLLRYFENKSLREVGTALGASENAAQKRLARAVERLREFFAKRGVTVGASGLVVVISTNAVQAAPAGLAVTISTAAALAGTTLTTTATATATKAIAMTTLQTTLVGAVLVAAVGTGIYEARKASTFRNQVIALKQQQAVLTEQLTRERDEATRQLAATRDGDIAELARLRGEVTRLRRDTQEFARLNVNSVQPTNRLPTVAAIIVTNLAPRVLSDDQIRASIQTQVGNTYSRSDIDRDIRTLYGTGLFFNIRVSEQRDESGVTLTYVVTEKGQATVFGGELRDLGNRTPEQAATSLIWATTAGQEARVSELLELPKGVTEEDTASHYKFFTKQLSNVFNTMEFLSVQGMKPNPDGTLRMNLAYREIATGKTNPFPFMLRLHDSGWRVVVEGNPPPVLPER